MLHGFIIKTVLTLRFFAITISFNIFTNSEYVDMHFINGLYSGNSRAVVFDYSRTSIYEPA